MVPGLSVYTTCPASHELGAAAYRATVSDVSRWSEAAGCTGALVYADNRRLDPWLVAQMLIGATERLVPLVAVQPVYMHPYTVAKLVSSIGFLHGRRVDLNLVAGGFKHDHEALDDHTPHDRRYDRLREYGVLVASLLRGGPPFTAAGEFYRVNRLSLTPMLPDALFSTFFVAGSSDAGRATAGHLGAVSVEYPSPATIDARPTTDGVLRRGIRFGIIARDRRETAWQVARARFPEDRRGRMVHGLATKASDSAWHHRLSAQSEVPAPYWMEPFLTSRTFCPYLVGSHAEVGEELRRYVDAGIEAVILDVPRDADDLGHTALAFEHAVAGIAR